MKKKIIMIMALVLCLTLLCSCGRSKNECTICGKKATHTFQDSGYCDEHYQDAIIWAMNHTN